MQLDNARHQDTGRAAAGYDGCCTGDDCKTESGCYCDVKCYYFRNCCDDITAIGCYHKCASYIPNFMCFLQHAEAAEQKYDWGSSARGYPCKASTYEGQELGGGGEGGRPPVPPPLFFSKIVLLTKILSIILLLMNWIRQDNHEFPDNRWFMQILKGISHYTAASK